MTTPHRIPPGRAGRLHLRRRHATATRAADLLERKLRVLLAEHRRLLEAEEETRRAWHEELRTAGIWLSRGLQLGGEQALATAALPGRAEVTVEWTTTMGAHHPARAAVASAVRTPSEPAPGNTALARAEAAYGDALRAAAAHAVARAAARAVGEEVLTTRQRVRALRRNWLPRLEHALAAVELALEEGEREDTVRLRWAAGRRPGTGPG
ncbi:V-type ATP synthase subunit D [Streptomyces morookaense]|uniref:V-type ATP synthase subunit D n=1 Tax=Streptomyces morookaense TaxID=1970 RepID=UPI0033CD2C67